MNKYEEIISKIIRDNLNGTYITQERKPIDQTKIRQMILKPGSYIQYTSTCGLFDRREWCASLL